MKSFTWTDFARGVVRQAILGGLILAPLAIPLIGQDRVRLVRNEKERRVDILIDGKPFTSYIWPENLKKPVLFPLRTAQGTVVTRGFPLDPRPGESVDHPHQVGSWFNYGDVNGVDFWNNSIYRTAQEAGKMGTIVHRRIIAIKRGGTRGELAVAQDWLLPDGTRILQETTRFTFYGAKGRRFVDRVTTLKALNAKVVFKDSKEGLFGLRVRHELEQPAKEPILLTDANGKAADSPILDNAGVSGEFRSSEGKTGDDVWGTRGRWASLGGEVIQEPITIVIFDNPGNPGFPTYWMARGYGLFAANPLGQKAYSSEKKEAVIRELNLALAPGKSVTFRYRLLIASEKLTTQQIELDYRKFAGETR